MIKRKKDPLIESLRRQSERVGRESERSWLRHIFNLPAKTLGPGGFQLVNCTQLCERWGRDNSQLRLILKQASKLRIFWIHPATAEIFELDPSKREEAFTREWQRVVQEAQFLEADVIDFESNHHEILPKTNTNLSGKERTEYGQLKREKEKWDKSLKAAVLAGIYCAESKDKVIRLNLQDNLLRAFPELHQTTFDKIWNAIPEDRRQGAGRPKNSSRK